MYSCIDFCFYMAFKKGNARLIYAYATGQKIAKFSQRKEIDNVMLRKWNYQFLRGSIIIVHLRLSYRNVCP